jgi:hypothetical protein
MQQPSKIFWKPLIYQLQLQMQQISLISSSFVGAFAGYMVSVAVLPDKADPD